MNDVKATHYRWENIPKEEAEAVKKKLEEAGGKVTLK